jgi:hypothetical protein
MEAENSRLEKVVRFSEVDERLIQADKVLGQTDERADEPVPAQGTLTLLGTDVLKNGHLPSSLLLRKG